MSDSSETLMAFLQHKPHLFTLSRDKNMMALMKGLEEGGGTAEELAQKYGFKREQLEKTLDELVAKGTLSKIQAGFKVVYFLDFDGKKFIDLYKAAKSALS